MIIGEFFQWNQTAKVEQRRQAASAIARICLDEKLGLEERCGAEAALALLMDDASPLVRRAIADQMSLAHHAPTHIIDELGKQPVSVSAPILVRSKLSPGFLRKRIAEACPKVHILIADRAQICEHVADALAQHADYDAILVLITNSGAHISAQSFDLIIARHATIAEMRGALFNDPRLSLMQRQKLIETTASAITSSPLVRNVLGETRAKRSCEQAIDAVPVYLTSGADSDDVGAFASALIEEGRVTSNLLLRSLVFGRIDFFAALVSDLTGHDYPAVQALLVNGRPSALRSLFMRGHLAEIIVTLCVNGVLVWRDIASGKKDIGIQELVWQLVQTVENSQTRKAENDDLAGLLRALYSEIVRDNALDHASHLIEQQISAIQLQRDAQQTAQPMLLDDADLDATLIEAFDAEFEIVLANEDRVAA